MTKLRAWRYLSVVMVVALILGVGAMAMPTSPALAAVPAGAWDIQTVDDGNVWATSLALDSYGYPHISYTTFGNSLHYARWTGTAWAKETVDNVPARATSLALDSNDYPHISYTTLTGQSVHYARWTGTAWVKETVEECDAWDCSLALNSYGYPHISYTTFGYPEGSLHYAWPTGTGWDMLTLDESPAIATSIALDSSNRPHISYSTGGIASLHYACLAGGAWDIQTVDERPVNSTSIALDSNDCPCIGYTTGGIGVSVGIGSLHYASLTDGVWDIQTVDGSDNLHSVSLALDSNDYPHISYATGGAPSLHYAHWTGTAWATETVDPRLVGATSLALDSSDYPHISYATAGLFSLHYARLIPPDTDTVNTGTGTATFSTSAGGIAKLTALAPTEIPCIPRQGTEFPQGLFSFNILGLDPGETVTVTITLPAPLPAGTQYWKCLNGQWVDCSSLLGDNDGDNVLTLTLMDGGLGDADGVANGTIIDPGGPAMPTPIVTAVSPNSGIQRQTLSPIITGINFTGATAVSFGDGIIVNSFAIDSDTQIRAGITITGNAVPGARDVSVTTTFGTGTLTGGFTVNSSAAPSNPNASPSMAQPSNLFSPAQLSAQYVSVNPQQTYANQPVTITANVVNTGGETGQLNVALKINGQVEQNRMVSVDPQGIQTVEFTVNKAQPGTYNVDILGKNGSFTILNAGSSTSSSPSENGGSKTGGLILLVSIGILIVASLVVLLVRRT